MEQEKKQKLIILTGPTAVGKTDLSIGLAKALNGAIISADSMQVYKKMDIGTAKITKEEMNGIDHYLIDILEPDEEFNVVKFKEYAREAIETIHRENKIPIVVGGTGFYIQALLYDTKFANMDTDYEYRQFLEKEAKEKGNLYLHQQLEQVDYEASLQIHPNNVKRVIRALEYYKTTNQKISEHNEEQRQNESPYDFHYFVLNMNRDALYHRINQRIDLMVKQGLVEEVTTLKKAGYERNSVAMQGIGYKELYSYLDNEISLEEAILQIKQNTRHFAKRQLTWFRREKEVVWVNKDEFQGEEQLLEFLLKEINGEQNQ